MAVSLPIILSGHPARAEKTTLLIERVNELSYVPILAIIQIGERSDSTAYIKAKKSFAEKIGVEIRHIHFSDDVLLEEIISTIKECNTDESVQGIIVQLPMPSRLDLDRQSIIATIEPSKDVDGLTSTNQDLLIKNDFRAIVPATARGVKELLDYYQIDLKGKKVVVVGRSALVGKPIALVCTNAGAVVNVCHSKTPNLAEETKKADILIVAVGKAGLIGKDHIKAGQIIIDVGINRVSLNGIDALKGDVDFDVVKDLVKAITPVPGGVGVMTVLALLENLIDACNK